MPLSPKELRHQMHQIPELMFREFETTRLILDNLANLPGIKIHKPIETGLIIEYSLNDGDYLLFRADIDALPIKEETSVSFASKSEYMHACGHDVHSSILYGFINYCISEKVNQNIIFLFQPAEEGGGGAKKIIDTGILKQFSISKAFALHVTDEYPVGTVASTPGVLFASSLEVNIRFKGKSAHVAFPYEGINAFNALRLFLDAVDKIPKNIEEPTLIGAGKISAGTVRNIVPSYAELEGTIRAITSEKALSYYENLIRILDGIKISTGADFIIEKGAHYNQVHVDPGLYKECMECLSPKFNFIDCGYKMTGEDFGFFTDLYPSFMFWLGTRQPGAAKFGLHHPKFLPDDSIIDLGIDAYKLILNS
ncbi:MAG: amidohydrolase [Ignavibacteriaceae bacterium]